MKDRYRGTSEFAAIIGIRAQMNSDQSCLAGMLLVISKAANYTITRMVVG
jgi:hypothetical protein